MGLTIVAKKPSLVVVYCLLGLLGLCSGPARAQDEENPVDLSTRQQLFQELNLEVDALERQGSILKKVVKLATPSVVHIEARKPTSSRTSFNTKPVEEAGSGVIVEVAGKNYIVTNRHVIKDSPLSLIDIHFHDGRMARPTNMWSDRFTDVAVMSVSTRELTPAQIGDSRKIEIGDFVLAFGSPFGLSQSVTYGIISAKGRRDLELGDGSIRYQDFMQTDAAINPGNSGGPLLNLRAEVIGINTAIASSSGGSEGIGFTIPIKMAMTVARQLIQKGRTFRAYLGVSLKPDFDNGDARRLGLERVKGALVSAVTPASPAARASFRQDDVVIEFDGYRIDDDDHLIQLVGFTEVGKEVTVIVYRGGQIVTLDVKLADRSTFEADG